MPETDKTSDTMNTRSKVYDAVDAARGKADADPLRPTFHFHPPSQWMNAPSGGIYHEGYYHVFYQYNPYSDSWNHIHWGHARTRDFLQWEHLPIALYPDDDIKESHCFSGSCILLPRDEPRIFYTSVSPNRDHIPNRQRTASGTRDLIDWEKTKEETLTIRDAPEGTISDWRDPYVVEQDGVYYMILGAVIPHKGRDRSAVLLYTAENSALSRWRYERPLYIFDETVTFPECPSFFKIQERWILIISPFGPVRYFLDDRPTPPDDFNPTQSGIIDRSSEFYATSVIHDKERVILFARIRGFPKGRGWNGCMAIPREIGFRNDGCITQTPIGEMKKLRKSGHELSPVELKQRRIVLTNLPVWNIEMQCSVDLPYNSKSLFCLSKNLSSIITIEFDAETKLIHVAGLAVPFPACREPETEITFSVFIDRSVIEIFIGDGQECITRCVEDLLGANRIIMETEGSAAFTEIRYWEMNSLQYTFSM
jgi:sucrose-6-phosphate hydrolase SacC (GH32 family)